MAGRLSTVCHCRYQYFLQLTKDMAEGRLVAPFQTTVLLASLAVQCESRCVTLCAVGHASDWLTRVVLPLVLW